eukprot:CAMPEP_0175052428 /NCGR_PEP_ID=MMETSP0052_2-20121109/8355_1 /TAXON_ID=51329 ORGANISM="Polytomella parva, Strain SAG 63-3" /NCGR_SAMPLE_ID=MMETSP0052_2 /ASSEMBLY_ACC=CAM_ASM_000194 /LENGTH=90 /DNA_ID=CAMNT_0016316833 /DNA_START=129 /DNA_END=398 /DNA_ORIENTATION=+
MSIHLLLPSPSSIVPSIASPSFLSQSASSKRDAAIQDLTRIAVEAAMGTSTVAVPFLLNGGGGRGVCVVGEERLEEDKEEQEEEREEREE